MRTETLLAFDFGAKRIGVAVGNSLLRQAQPLRVLEAANQERRFSQIAELISEWQPDRLVVGIPTDADGQSHEMTRRCERFANQLHGRFGLPIERVDERYSSLEAEDERRRLRARRELRSHSGVDQLAAQIILQRYFETAHD